MADDVGNGLPDGSSVRIDGRTPNGGAYSICYYRLEDGRPAAQDVATRAEIVEFTSDNQAIHRTYTRLGGKR